MKALQLIKPGEPVIVDIAVPPVGDDEMLVRVEAVTTCPRWDILMYEGTDVLDLTKSPDYPLPAGWPGHEIAGVVVETGTKVCKFQPGDRIAAHWVKVYTEGESGYAEYAKFREDEIVPLPDHVSFEEAAPFELLKCVVRGMNQFGGEEGIRGKSIAVAGLGPAGLLAMQLARIWGASRVVGADVSEKRIAYARERGVGEVVHADELKDQEVDLGYDCVGFSSSVQNLIRATRRHVVVFGVLHGEVKITDEHWLRGFKLECFDSTPLTEAELDLAMDAAANRGLDTKLIITHHGKLADYREAIRMLKQQEAIKVCFFPASEFGTSAAGNKQGGEAHES